MTTPAPAATTQQPAGALVYKWEHNGATFEEVKEPSGTYYRKGTPREVINAIEQAHRSGARVRVWYGDPDTGADWNEENDITGFIGRTTGPLHVPILKRSANSSGGPAILVHCIVRLSVAGREVWRHPNYTEPVYTISTAQEDGAPLYPVAVKINGEVYARFETQQKAARWVQFMKNERATM